MLKDFVLETSNAPGTATVINLAGAATDRLAFATVFPNGSPVFYYLDDGTMAEWGVGVFNTGAPNTLTRSTVLSNTSNTTARLAFAGVTRVYNELPSARMVYIDNTNTLRLPAGARLDPVAGGLPIGMGAIWFSPLPPPPGWVICGGQWLNRTTYAALYAVLGNTYGAGDGVSAFATPDLRGRVPVGRDDMAIELWGGSAARVSGVLASNVLGAAGGDQWLQAHSHAMTVNDAVHTHGLGDAGHDHPLGDYGHTHTYDHGFLSSGITPQQQGPHYANLDLGGTGTYTTSNGSTLGGGTPGSGIIMGISGSNISIGAAWANVNSGTVYSAGAGGSQNIQPSIIVNYIIYAGV